MLESHRSLVCLTSLHRISINISLSCTSIDGFLLCYVGALSLRLGVLDDDQTRTLVTTDDTRDYHVMSRLLLYSGVNPVLIIINLS